MKNKKVFAIMAVAGFLMSLGLTLYYGLGVRQDTIVYVTCAQNLLQGKGFVAFYKRPDETFDLWTPLLPVILAFLGRLTSLDPLDIIWLLNPLYFGLAILMSGFWLAKHIKDRRLVLFGAVLVLFSKPLLFISTSGWSESLFLVLALSFLLSAEAYAEGDRRIFLFSMAAFASLFVMTRYAGVIALLTGGLVILIKKNPWKRKLGDGFVFGLIAGIPLAAWMIRNIRVSQAPTGLRIPSNAGFFDDLKMLLDVISSWFLPGYFGPPIRIVIFGLFVLAMVVLFVKRKERFGGGGGRGFFREYQGLLFFSIFYALFIWVTRSYVEMEKITDRYLSPVFVPFLLVVLSIIERSRIRDDLAPPRSLGRKMIFPAVLVYLVHQLAFQILPSVNILKTDGLKALAPPRNSSFLEYLRKMPYREGDYFISDTPDVLSMLAKKPIDWSPLRDYGLDGFGRKISNLPPSADIYLIWAPRRNIQQFFNPGEIQGKFRLEPIIRTPDGDVYRFRR